MKNNKIKICRKLISEGYFFDSSEKKIYNVEIIDRLTWLKIYKDTLDINDKNDYIYANKKFNKYVMYLGLRIMFLSIREIEVIFKCKFNIKYKLFKK